MPLTAEDVASRGQPTEHDIRVRAYERYLERGGGHGNALSDWILAEQELRDRRKN